MRTLLMGSGSGLRDFALIVALVFLAPLWVLRRSGLRSARARLALALGLWCALWALPIAWQQWKAWGAAGVDRYRWWSEVLPQLAPYFVVPVIVLVVIFLLRRDARPSAGSAGCTPASRRPGSHWPAAG